MAFFTLPLIFAHSHCANLLALIFAQARCAEIKGAQILMGIRFIKLFFTLKKLGDRGIVLSITINFYRKKINRVTETIHIFNFDLITCVLVILN